MDACMDLISKLRDNMKLQWENDSSMFFMWVIWGINRWMRNLLHVGHNAKSHRILCFEKKSQKIKIIDFRSHTLKKLIRMLESWIFGSEWEPT